MIRRPVVSLLLCCMLMAAAPLAASENTTFSGPRLFVSHRVIRANIWWLGPATMEYVVRGVATQRLSESEGSYLAIQDFTVKVVITPDNPWYEGWVFQDRTVANRVYQATYDPAAGLYRVRADGGTFWFRTRFPWFWLAGWTGIMLSFPPGGDVSVTPATDNWEDWWFL
jgi:hypothetical protein